MLNRLENTAFTLSGCDKCYVEVVVVRLIVVNKGDDIARMKNFNVEGW